MLNHITHKMPIYKDCTLTELMVTASVTLIILTLLLSILTKLLIGYAWPGYILATIFFFFVTKLALLKLQKLKYGKPHAYYQHLIVKKLSQLGLINNVYLIRSGKWSVRRIIHE
jgi:conjugative transfer region protein (TIGR03750 family)